MLHGQQRARSQTPPGKRLRVPARRARSFHQYVADTNFGGSLKSTTILRRETACSLSSRKCLAGRTDAGRADSNWRSPMDQHRPSWPRKASPMPEPVNTLRGVREHARPQGKGRSEQLLRTIWRVTQRTRKQEQQQARAFKSRAPRCQVNQPEGAAANDCLIEGSFWPKQETE